MGDLGMSVISQAVQKATADERRRLRNFRTALLDIEQASAATPFRLRQIANKTLNRYRKQPLKISEHSKGAQS